MDTKSSSEPTGFKGPTCPYCKAAARLVNGKVIYPATRRADLIAKSFWLCAPCKAYVGCHPGTVTPLGRLADADLRQAKMAAHDAFDPLWRSGRMRRGEAYAWLAAALGIPVPECHVGMFDLARCADVVRVCRAYSAALAAGETG